MLRVGVGDASSKVGVGEDAKAVELCLEVVEEGAGLKGVAAVEEEKGIDEVEAEEGEGVGGGAVGDEAV